MRPLVVPHIVGRVYRLSLRSLQDQTPPIESQAADQCSLCHEKLPSNISVVRVIDIFNLRHDLNHLVDQCAQQERERTGYSRPCSGCACHGLHHQLATWRLRAFIGDGIFQDPGKDGRRFGGCPNEFGQDPPPSSAKLSPRPNEFRAWGRKWLVGGKTEPPRLFTGVLIFRNFHV